MQEEYRKDMTLKEAEVVALSTLKQVMEEKVRSTAHGMQWHALLRQCRPSYTTFCKVGSMQLHDFRGYQMVCA